MAIRCSQSNNIWRSSAWIFRLGFPWTLAAPFNIQAAAAAAVALHDIRADVVVVAAGVVTEVDPRTRK